MPNYRQNAKFAGRGPLPPRTLDYLAKGAPKGVRNEELFAAAGQFRDAGYHAAECWDRLLDRALKDGLTEAEARKTFDQAFSVSARNPIGKPAGGTAPSYSAAAQSATPRPAPTFNPLNMVNLGPTVLPDPIPDGFSRFLETVFEPDEYVSISEAILDGAGNLAPGAGQVLKREKWLEAAKDGKLDKMFPAETGVYIRINPMKPGGKTDKEVAVFRHVLAEFDLDQDDNRIPLLMQCRAFVQTGLPISTVTFSGDKSLHGLVKVDAANRQQWDERCKAVFEAFGGQAYLIDPQNKNPSRYSRVPGFNRTLTDENGNVYVNRQELLALRIGAVDWPAYEAALNRAHFSEIIFGDRLRKEIVPIPDDIIAGLIAHGEKGQLAGGTKSYKTWTLIDQALAIANGRPWWGMKTVLSNVIFLNLELPRAFFEARLRQVANTLGIGIPDNFGVWHLRGTNLADPDRWLQFVDLLDDCCSSVAKPFLIIDPIYKLLGGRNENATGDVASLLWQLEDMVQRVGGTNFYGHHFAKGDSTAKVAIDRMAGSGTFSRDPDSIFVMTAHEKAGCFTVESILRNHAPLDSFVVEWKEPIFLRDDSLDPAELKRAPVRRGAKPRFDPSVIVKWLGADCLSSAQLKKRVMDETGMGKTAFYDLRTEAEKRGLIAFDGQAQTWEVCGNSNTNSKKTPSNPL